MSTITCKVCGEHLGAGQCKCQSFSEVPIPKQQTVALSTDGAIREGEPPHHSVRSIQGELPNEPSLTLTEKTWILVKSILACTIMGMLGMASFIGIAYSRSEGGLPTELLMQVWAILYGAPIGLIAGIIVGGFLIELRRNKSTQS